MNWVRIKNAGFANSVEILINLILNQKKFRKKMI